MNPSPFAYRLPSEQEVIRILSAAKNKSSQTVEGKAKSNLLKSLDWAYTGLTQQQRQQVVYMGTAALGEAVKNKDTITDEDIKSMRQCLVVRFTGLQHPGNSLKVLDTGQQQTITQLLEWFNNTNNAINNKTHDEALELLFPPDTSETLDNRREEVVRRLRRAHECVTKLAKESKIVVAEYHTYVKSGGGGGPNSVDLKPDFFTTYTGQERQATFVHEATHTIPTKDMHTEDYCYIHQPQFSKAKLATRYLNASHFEALIRLINGEKLKLADGKTITGSSTGKQQRSPKTVASEILTAAWIQAWRWYGDLAKRHQTNKTTFNVNKGPSRDEIDWAHVLGLSWGKIEKGYFSTDVTISNSDLAFLENRVGKLGVLMGGSVIERAAEATAEKKDLTFTSAELQEPKLQVDKVEKLLTQVIQLEGPLRKTSNNKKSVDMIMALAECKIEEEKNVSIKLIVNGRYDRFLSTYPRIK